MVFLMGPSTEQIEGFRTIGDIMEWAGFTVSGDPGDVGPTFPDFLGVEATSPFVDLAAVTAADLNAAVGTWRTGAGPSAGTNTTLQQRGMAMRVGKAIRIACGVGTSTAQVRSLQEQEAKRKADEHDVAKMHAEAAAKAAQHAVDQLAAIGQRQICLKEVISRCR